MDSIVELAWPIVLLVGIVSVWALFGRDARKLPVAIADLRRLVDDLPKVQELASQLSEIKNDLTSLKNDSASLGQKVSEVRQITAQESVERGSQEIAVATTSDVTSDKIEKEAEQNKLTPSQMYIQAMDRWEQFRQAFEDQLKEAGVSDYDLRSYKDAAKKLTDGRRKQPMNKEDIELFSRLQGQYKRFTRMQSYVDDWLTPQIYAQFLAVLDEAMSKLPTTERRSR